MTLACVRGLGKYGWTFVSCKAFKVCNKLAHTHTLGLYHTHAQIHTVYGNTLHKLVLTGSGCDCKDVPVCGGECAQDEN